MERIYLFWVGQNRYGWQDKDNIYLCVFNAERIKKSIMNYIFIGTVVQFLAVNCIDLQILPGFYFFFRFINFLL